MNDYGIEIWENLLKNKFGDKMNKYKRGYVICSEYGQIEGDDYIKNLYNKYTKCYGQVYIIFDIPSNVLREIDEVFKDKKINMKWVNERINIENDIYPIYAYYKELI